MKFLDSVKRMMLSGASLIVHFAHGALLVVGAISVVWLGHTLLQKGVDALRPIAAPWLAWNQFTPRARPLEDAMLRVAPRTRALADYVARKYRVAPSAALQLISAAEDAATREGVDAMLVIAVMAVESGFNPIAESHMGAQGLMQVIPRYHQDKLADLPAGLLDPATNIRVGARVLKAYLDQTDSVTAALQVYCGAPGDPDASYATRVLEEKQRLEEAARRTRGVPA